mmetsp:Transcript_17531/g.44674  ORF Transcript_17531/g.44674 Transcript_17531/m.44674 type:complete len:195 (+) Transcript_17531:1269-1853(+)
MSTGEGTLQELRETDLSSSAARTRYQTFREQTMDSLQSLKNYFPYHIIDAMGSIESVEDIIRQELQYQSSLELGERTYAAIAHISTAEEVSVHARQELVQRLDSYERDHNDTFMKVINLIATKFIPHISRYALGGKVIVECEDCDVCRDDALAREMIFDILTDRNFNVLLEEGTRGNPRFHIKFEGVHLKYKKH